MGQPTRTVSSIREENEYTAVERAHFLIQEAILEGSLKGGKLLTEQELEKLTGVSRTPIRDALKRLEDEGLVVVDRTLRNRKSYVANLTQEHVEELIVVRSLLESYVAKRAAEKILPEQVAELEIIQDQIDAAIDEKGKGAASDFAQLNLDFHRTIWEIGSLRIARLVYSTLSTPFRMVNIPDEKMVDHLRLSSMYHREIIYALKERDGEAAAQQMRAHVISSIKYVDRPEE